MSFSRAMLGGGRLLFALCGGIMLADGACPDGADTCDGTSDSSELMQLSRNRPAAPGTTATTAPRITIYFDGQTPTPVPKQSVDDSPMRMFYSIPLGANGDISVNSTHAFIPHGAAVQSIYIRNMTVPSSPGWALDYGVANQRWTFNHVSIFPNSTFGAAEKLVQVGAGGFVSSATYERIKADIKDRWFLTKAAAKSMADERSLLVNLALLQSRTGSALAAAGLDTVQVQKLAAENTHDIRQIDPSVLELAQSLKRMRGSLKADERAVKSSNNCYHFAAQITGNGMVVPLGKGLVSYRGQVTFAPYAKFSIVVATTTMKRNLLENTLEVYVEASSVFFVADLNSHDNPPASVYFQGHPHTAKDNREQKSKPSLTAFTLHTLYQNIPPDYMMFWEPDTCPPRKEASVKAALGAANYALMVHEPPSAIQALRSMQLSVEAMACGHPYMQSSIPRSHSYGMFEAFVWVHMLLEMSPDIVGDVATWKGWNNVGVLERFTTN